MVRQSDNCLGKIRSVIGIGEIQPRLDLNIEGFARISQQFSKVFNVGHWSGGYHMSYNPERLELQVALAEAGRKLDNRALAAAVRQISALVDLLDQDPPKQT